MINGVGGSGSSHGHFGWLGKIVSNIWSRILRLSPKNMKKAKKAAAAAEPVIVNSSSAASSPSIKDLQGRCKPVGEKGRRKDTAVREDSSPEPSTLPQPVARQPVVNRVQRQADRRLPPQPAAQQHNIDKGKERAEREFPYEREQRVVDERSDAVKKPYIDYFSQTFMTITTKSRQIDYNLFEEEFNHFSLGRAGSEESEKIKKLIESLIRQGKSATEIGLQLDGAVIQREISGPAAANAKKAIKSAQFIQEFNKLSAGFETSKQSDEMRKLFRRHLISDKYYPDAYLDRDKFDQAVDNANWSPSRQGDPGKFQGRVKGNAQQALDILGLQRPSSERRRRQMQAQQPGPIREQYEGVQYPQPQQPQYTPGPQQQGWEHYYQDYQAWGYQRQQAWAQQFPQPSPIEIRQGYHPYQGGFDYDTFESEFKRFSGEQLPSENLKAIIRQQGKNAHQLGIELNNAVGHLINEREAAAAKKAIKAAEFIREFDRLSGRGRENHPQSMAVKQLFSACLKSSRSPEAYFLGAELEERLGTRSFGAAVRDNAIQAAKSIEGQWEEIRRIDMPTTYDRDDLEKFSVWANSGGRDARGDKLKPAKRALLERTIGTTKNQHDLSIPVCFQAKAPSDFEWRLHQRQLDPAGVRIGIGVVSDQRDFYTYDETSYFPGPAYYVNFSNPEHFGGGFRGNGNVQEERMLIESTASRIAYEHQGLRPVSWGEPTPIILCGVVRQFDVSQTPYGRAIDRANQNEVRRAVRDLNPPQTYNMIAIAAQDRSRNRSPYTREDLVHHLKGFYAGFLVPAKSDDSDSYTIHTGLIGCGAFKNSWQTMIYLQILAMHMVEADTGKRGELRFHGLDRDEKTGMHQDKKQRKFVYEAEQHITALLRQGYSADDIITGLLNFQSSREGKDFMPQEDDNRRGRRRDDGGWVGE